MRNQGSASKASLLRCIHAAGVDAAQWPGVLERLRQEFGASVVTLARHEFTTGCELPLYESPDGLDFSRDIAAYAARNPWYLSSDDYEAGRVMTGDELVSPMDLRRTDFYRGFLRPRGLLHRLCGVVAHHDGGACLLSAYRSEERGAFGAHDKAELSALLGHITLSMESQWRWQEADELARALLGLAHHEAHPMMLLTEAGEPVHLNPAAERLLGMRAGLCLEGGLVAAATQADRRLLREAMAQVAAAAPGDAAAAPRVVSLASAAPGPPLVAVARAAGQVFASRTGTRRALVLLTVRGGVAGHDPASCTFARQYELTGAQARVSALVFSGQPLAAIARSLNVSENTVRSHLKVIFQKTGTHGQMDLVHLHARVCASPA